MSMDQGGGSERERVVHDERADARERVRVAQEHEASAREVKRGEARQRTTQRQPLAMQEAHKPVVPDEVPNEPPQLDGPDANGNAVMAVMDRGQGIVQDEHAPAAPHPIGALEPTVIPIMEAGRRLRSVLKDRYPTVRFRVRVRRGVERSIDIEWTSGPLADEVVTIARDYIDGGHQRASIVNDGGADSHLPRQVVMAEGGRYDISRIEVYRLKTDGSVDTNRVVHANGIE